MFTEAIADRFRRSHRSRRADLSVAAYCCAFGSANGETPERLGENADERSRPTDGTAD